MSTSHRGKVLNEESGRWVKKTGVIGKRIMAGKCGSRSKVFNTETKKCVKCPRAKVFNPDTYRCVKGMGAVARKKKIMKCPRGKVLNPDTHRCIDGMGAVARKKKIMKCPRGKVLNPDTHRCVSQKGRSGLELLGKYMEF
uniref:Uncharacterized protein n=1 Tax=Marseillevirus LCMAC102 TaxID=2506603 RepID=A0A481YTL5_9VIRU|nr:MAG: hypothetical protein LCMAC102_00360 [Marseillevirus LCMAC102]